jgi:hypothetical protein
MIDTTEHVWVRDPDRPEEAHCSACGHSPCPVHEPYSYARWQERQIGSQHAAGMTVPGMAGWRSLK